MKKEKPIRVIPSRHGHRTEVRVFARNIHETFCTQPRCKFFGKHAQQGVCFSRGPMAGKDWAYIDAAFEYAELACQEQLVAMRKWWRRNPKGYVKELEAHVYCGWLNNTTMLNELVRLRRKVALLELKKGKRRG